VAVTGSGSGGPGDRDQRIRERGRVMEGWTPDARRDEREAEEAESRDGVEVAGGRAER